MNIKSKVNYNEKIILNADISRITPNKAIEKSSLYGIKNSVKIYRSTAKGNIKRNSNSDSQHYFIEEDIFNNNFIQVLLLYLCCCIEKMRKNLRIYQKFTNATEDLISFTSYINMIHDYKRKNTSKYKIG